MRLRALILAALLVSAPALAEDRQFANGEAVSVQPDQGYLLVRTYQRAGGALRGTLSFAPVLIRVLSDAELAQAKSLADADPVHWQDKVESNIAEPMADEPYAQKDNEEVMLIALKPGTYILGSVAVSNWASIRAGGLIASLCMGTVKFEVKPGVITDMGTILNARDSEPTTIPELANVVAGKPIGANVMPDTVAIRPATAADVPDQLRALVVVPADYHAAGAFPNYFGVGISRLAPLPGVLDYDKDGHVIDLRAGAKHS